MRALVLQSLNGPDQLEVTERPEPEAAADEVVIDVQAAGIGFADVLISKGGYQVRPETPFIPGMELTGTIRTSPDGSGLAPGTRVTAITGLGGACADVVAVPPRWVFPAPQSLDVAAAGGLVVNYHTAYFALERRAGLRSGETVLVQGAGGGLGQAVIQVASAMGAVVIAVASTDSKRAAALAAGADIAIGTADGWVQEARGYAGGAGVDVVVDPVGGDRFDDNVRVLAPGGRLVVVGFAAGAIPSVKVSRLLLRNISVVGAAWREFITDTDPDYASLTADALNVMITRGQVMPRPGATFPLADGAEAFKAIDEQRITGRAVITF